MRRPERSGAVHDRDVLDELRDDWCAFREEIAEEPDPAFVLLDETFHVTLAEAAGNPVVADLLRQVNERIRIVRSQDFMTGGRIRQTIDEHIAITEAVLAGDIDGACARFVAHLDRSVSVVEDRVNRAIARMITGGGQ